MAANTRPLRYRRTGPSHSPSRAREARRAPAIAFALLAVVAVPAAAQTIGPWDDPDRAGTIALDLQKPTFENEGFDFTTAMVFLTTRWTALHGVTLVAELPFAHAGVDNLFGGPVSASAIGNPYVGIEAALGRTGGHAELGFRPPIGNNTGDARDQLIVALAGLVADYDRLEAFLNDVWSVRARLSYRWRSAAGLTVGGTAGPTLLIGGEDSPLNEANLIGEGTDTALDYRLDVAYNASRFSVGTAFTGRNFLGDRGGVLTLTEGVVHQLAFGVGVTLGKARPSMVARFPLDRDLSGALRFVIGLGVSVQP